MDRIRGRQVNPHEEVAKRQALDEQRSRAVPFLFKAIKCSSSLRSLRANWAKIGDLSARPCTASSNRAGRASKDIDIYAPLNQGAFLLTPQNTGKTSCGLGYALKAMLACVRHFVHGQKPLCQPCQVGTGLHVLLVKGTASLDQS